MVGRSHLLDDARAGHVDAVAERVGERVREARARADLEVLQDGRSEVLANLEL